MTQAKLSSGDAVGYGGFTGGNDGTLVVEVGAAGSKVNAIEIAASGEVSAPQGLAASTSAKVLIQRQTASGAVASIDFAAIQNSTFNNYELVLEGFLPTTNTVNLLLQLEVGGSWVTSGYYWANWRWTTAGSGVVGQGGTGSGIALNAAGADNMANVGSPANWIIRITNCAQTSRVKRVSYEGAYVGSTTINLRGNGESPGTGAVTGFRLIMDSGTIQSGAVASLYGNK